MRPSRSLPNPEHHAAPASGSPSPACTARRSVPFRASPAFVRSACVFVFAVALAFVAPAPARAHGPTVELTAKGLEPVLLNLFEGTTVHFSNTLVAPEGLVVVDESGLLESPPLKQPGEGWHFTFDKTGSYVIHVRERPEATMRIVVVPKRTP